MVAPALGAAVSTVNPLAGAAVSILSNVLLGHPNGTEDDVALAMYKATPEQLLAIKQEDHNFQINWDKLGLELEAVSEKDRESARELGEKTTLWPQIIMTIIYTVGYFVLMYQMAEGNIHVDGDLKMEFSALVGVLTAVQAQIFNFWFGSSKSSHDAHVLLGQR